MPYIFQLLSYPTPEVLESVRVRHARRPQEPSYRPNMDLPQNNASAKKGSLLEVVALQSSM